MVSVVLLLIAPCAAYPDRSAWWEVISQIYLHLANAGLITAAQTRRVISSM